MLSKEAIKALDKRHMVHSWSVQADLDPLVVEKGEGVYYWDIDGNRYLDFSSALVNLSVGHQHPKVVAGIKAQADKQCYIHPGIACTSRVELARDLAELTPGDLNRFFFTLGGADANENAIKIARAFTGKSKILTKYRGYHGATYGAITLSGDPRRIPVEPGIPGVVRFFDPYCYRCSFGLTYPQCNLLCVENIDEIIRYEGAHSVAAVLIETMTGAGGFFVPPAGYFERLREICDTHGVLLILDEVMVGCGRTGKWFCVQHWDIVPDIMTLAKGISSGYIPLGATAMRDWIAEKFENSPYLHGHTYSGHALAMAAGVACLEVYRDDNLIERSAEMGNYLMGKMFELQDKHPSVGDIRGKGLFGGMELVKSRKTKEPTHEALMEPPRPVTSKMKVIAKAMEAGLYIMGGAASVLVMAPPLTITKDEIDFAMSVVDQALAISDAEYEG